MDRLLTLGLIYSLFLLAQISLNYIIWVPPGEELVEHKHLVFVITALILCLATIILAARLTPRTSDFLMSKLTVCLATRKYLVGLALVLVAVIWPLVTADVVLDRFINSGDEFAYVFQARGLAEGRLWYEAPPLGNTFVAMRTWVLGDKWVGQYPPGWPFFLAAGQLAGIPLWAVNAVFGGMLAVIFLITLWRWLSAGVALVTTAILIGSPFYLFNAASYHSHITAALSLLLFTILYKRHLATSKPLPAFFSGVSLGILGTIRYFSVPLAGAALLANTLWNRKLLPRGTALIILGGLPFLGLLLYCHFKITGDPLKSTYSVIDWKEEIWLSTGLEQLINGLVILARGMLSLSEWTCPVIPLAYAISLIFKIRSRSCKFYDFIFPVFVMGYMFFPSLGGNRYGPRYYFDAYPLMMLTIATAYDSATNFARQFDKGRFVTHGLTVSLIYCILSYPFIAYRYHSIIWERQDIFRLTQAAQLSNAVVLIKSDIGILWSMPAWDLARNEPGLKENVLFANGVGALTGPTADAGAIRHLFPDRSLWIYERDPGNPHGQLRPAD
jgi:hypothetical protein